MKLISDEEIKKVYRKSSLIKDCLCSFKFEKAIAQAQAELTREETLEVVSEWLSHFVMKFYATAKKPTYENMKPLYQELFSFSNSLLSSEITKEVGN